MITPAIEAEVRAARAYEALFVPALFGQFANRLVDAAHLRAGDRVLDVACGSGVLARRAALRTAPGGSVAGLDPDPGMLAVARESAPGIGWRQGAAEAIPFPDEEFDAVVSQFGLMFMDPQAALREMLRVLRPSGRLVIAVWDSLETMPAYVAEVSLIECLAGSGAADALRAPFVLGNRQRLGELFQGARATSVSIGVVEGVADFPDVRVMVEADLRGWLPVMGVSLTETEIDRILEEAQQALSRHVQPDGRMKFVVRALLVTAQKC